MVRARKIFYHQFSDDELWVYIYTLDNKVVASMPADVFFRLRDGDEVPTNKIKPKRKKIRDQ